MRFLRHVAVVVAISSAFLAGRWSADTLTLQPRARAESAKADDKAAPAPIKGWQKGKGWGWIWGKDDEVGALNAMTPETVRAALHLAKTGKVYDLGVPYDRGSFKWPGHSPGEIMTFRGPEGVQRQGDFPDIADARKNPTRTAWHSCALFISDNVGTQVDGLAHIVTGEDNHWYNGFTEQKWGGNWGVRRCDANSIPPIITRGVLIDVPGARGLETLPPHFRITAEVLQATLEKQGTELRTGDTVLVRTGTVKHWGDNGSDHDKLRPLDTAGIDIGAAKWLVEQKGAILIGSDTSGLEWNPNPTDKDAPADFIPVHRYLLVEQGVHIGEFHNLEDLARDKTYEFCYVCATNKIRGTTAGFTLRPLALR